MGRLLKISKLDIDTESLTRLKAINGFSAALVPNHVNHADPYVMFALVNRLRDQFHYLTAQESFYAQAGGRLRGLLLQKLGCYSVVRGVADRDSFRMPRSILPTDERKLVAFAEGAISQQNDAVMPYESGVTQLCFWAMDAMKKVGEVKPVYLVPVALKYIYQKDMSHEIENALTRLERKLRPKKSSPSDDS